MFLKESEFIEAQSVGIERTFYENESGEILSGSNLEIDERNLLIKPDVTFYDVDNKPILFIEIVATHGIDAEKRAKLARLGINCIQVRIPKDKPEAIESIFSITERTKWEFNYDESITDYISISNGNPEGIPPIDEQQRKIFAESFNCRQSQINNLIRTIKRCLESKPYRRIEESIRSEISRVEKNTESARAKLDGIREECRVRVNERFKTEIDQIGRQESEFDSEEKKYINLEGRYFKKKTEIAGEEKFFVARFKGEISKMDGEGKSIEERKREIDEASNDIRIQIEDQNRIIDRHNRDEETERRNFKGTHQSIIEESELLARLIKSKTDGVTRDIEKYRSEEEQLPEYFRNEEEAIPGWIESETKRIESEFEDSRKRLHEGFNSKCYTWCSNRSWYSSKN